MDLNRQWWDERVPIHVASRFYDIDGFRAGRESLMAHEPGDVGAVEGRTLLHLQCHIGLDTLSWARRGAKVVGLDFSEPAVAAARALAADLGLDAEFVAADVYDAVAALDRRRFDVVYTGIGALTWLPDLDRWAAVVAELIAPGGCLYLTEFHPFTWVLGEDGGRVVRDYFDRGPHEFDDPGSYADPQARTAHDRTMEWQHPLGDVVTAVARAGLRVELLRELDETACPFWPLERRGATWRTPDGIPRVPLMYALRARG